MKEMPKYTIGGKEFTLKFPNYETREQIRDFEGTHRGWVLYRDETIEAFKILLEGDHGSVVDGEFVNTLKPEDITKEISKKVQADFFERVEEEMNDFTSYSKR